MKYVVSWSAQAGGSAGDLEAAQKRVLELFQKWHAPDNMKFLQFLSLVGEFGGYAVIETDSPAELHKAANIFAVFKFRAEPVLDITDAVAAQAEAIAWRESVSR